MVSVAPVNPVGCGVGCLPVALGASATLCFGLPGRVDSSRERGKPVARTRHPAVAGTFYPDDARELRASVSSYLASAASAPRSEIKAPTPKALIAPHAGYIYSGPIAASAYARWTGLHSRVERVILLGPSHRIPLEGLAASSADCFDTPLGAVPIDREAVERSLALPQVRLLDAAHDREHSLEVQLPFLQEVLGEFALVPFSVGDATPDEVAEVLELLWGGDETRIVISSDLSHYSDYKSAQRFDAETTRAIEELRPEALDYESACGRVPVSGLLRVAQRKALTVTTLDLRNSGDTAGSRGQVVGYGAYAIA